MTAVPERVGIVINPTAGGRGAVAVGREVVGELARREIDIIDCSGRTSAEAGDRLQAAVRSRQIDAVVVVGGDGVVNLATNALAGSGIPLVIVPAGTGNDTATALGVPLRSPIAALDLMRTGAMRSVDAAKVSHADGSSAWFVGVLAGGFDAVVNERANAMRWPKGRSKYTVAAMAELPVFRPIPYRITIDGVRHDTGAMLVAVANTTSYGGGMKVVPGALLDDGLLDVLIVGPLSTATFIRVFPRVFSGKHIGHPAVSVVRGRHIELEAPDIVAYADGERLGPLPCTIEAAPGALRVLGAQRRPGLT